MANPTGKIAHPNIVIDVAEYPADKGKEWSKRYYKTGIAVNYQIDGDVNQIPEIVSVETRTYEDHKGIEVIKQFCRDQGYDGTFQVEHRVEKEREKY